MNPQANSLLTSMLKDVLTLAGGALVAKGYLTSGQEAQFVTIAAGILLTGGSQLLTWYKERQVTPTALIQKVNAGDNGVKVVPASVPESVAPTVVVPLK